LRFLLSRDDCPYHGFFPAAWPVASGSTQTFTWAVVCANGGLRQLLLRLRMERAGTFAIREIEIEALSFYNGQVMSPAPLANAKLTISEHDAAGTGEVVLDAPDFNLRDPALVVARRRCS